MTVGANPMYTLHPYPRSPDTTTITGKVVIITAKDEKHCISQFGGSVSRATQIEHNRGVYMI